MNAVSHIAGNPLKCVSMAPGEVPLILEGKKTEFRRCGQFGRVNVDPDAYSLLWTGVTENRIVVELDSKKRGSSVIHCNFGAPGNVVSLHESWFQDGADLYFQESTKDNRFPWRSPQALPENKARAKIRLEQVICQRLSDMTDENAEREGVIIPHGTHGFPNNLPHVLIPQGLENRTRVHLGAFFAHWDDLYGKACLSCHNPWCWAMKFSLLKTD